MVCISQLTFILFKVCSGSVRIIMAMRSVYEGCLGFQTSVVYFVLMYEAVHLRSSSLSSAFDDHSLYLLSVAAGSLCRSVAAGSLCLSVAAGSLCL